MRQGIRVIAHALKGTVVVNGQRLAVSVDPDEDLARQVNGYIGEVERDVSEDNARAGGFVPFGSWMNRSTVKATIPAGASNLVLLVTHRLGAIPTSYLVTYPGTGSYTMVPVEPWSSEVAKFMVSSTPGTTLKIVFWRDE